MIRLRTLGTLDLTHSDGPELRTVMSQPRRTALLVYLATATPRGFHRRDHLLTLFWSDDDLERARSSLNRAVYFLRRELGEGIIVSRGADELGLNFDHFWCDAGAFEDALDRMEWDVALDLYRGDLLPGFFAARAAGFERWLETTRSRLRERAAAASGRAAAECESRGELLLAARFARRRTELAPFDEVGVRRLMTLLDRAGDRAGAARSYQAFAERMAADLELAPSPETRALLEDIRSRGVANGATTDTARFTSAAAPAGEPTPADRATQTISIPSPTRRIPNARRRTLVAGGTVAVAAAVALGFGLPALARARIDPRLVHAIPFANRTDDPALDKLARLASDRITESLARTALVDAVRPDDGRPTTRAAAGAKLPRDARELAAGSRAGTIVSGEFHLEGGRVVVQAWITDVQRNRVAWAVGPSSAARDSAGPAIDEISRRVTGAVAALRSPRFASWFPIATSPPTFDAFQAFAEATDLQSRGFDEEAVPHLRKAVALDTTFTWAKLQLALAHLNLFEQAAADSIVDALNGDRDALNPLQRHWLAWMLALRTDDHLAGYHAIRAAAELAPERFRFNVAQWAMRLNRPREAIAALELLGPDNPHGGGPGAYWTLLTQCYHAVGDGERELGAAQRARHAANIEPMNALALEIKARASLGSLEAVEALLDTALGLPREHGPTSLQRMVGISRISTPAQLMVSAALELRAHGHEDAAQRTLARALAWYHAQSPHAANAEGRRFEIANVLYLARDWDAADTAFRAMAAADPGNFILLGYIGTIAARRRDEATARAIIAKFDSLRPTLPQSRAVAGYWQAKISALLGDEARALALLSEVWPQGHFLLHAEFDYESMWRAPAFRALVRPKG